MSKENKKKTHGKAAIMFLSSIIILFLFQQENDNNCDFSSQIYADGFAAIFGKSLGKLKYLKTWAGTSTFYY